MFDSHRRFSARIDGTSAAPARAKGVGRAAPTAAGCRARHSGVCDSGRCHYCASAGSRSARAAAGEGAKAHWEPGELEIACAYEGGGAAAAAARVERRRSERE